MQKNFLRDKEGRALPESLTSACFIKFKFRTKPRSDTQQNLHRAIPGPLECAFPLPICCSLLILHKIASYFCKQPWTARIKNPPDSCLWGALFGDKYSSAPDYSERGIFLFSRNGSFVDIENKRWASEQAGLL